jgi:pimeloyl-ACP methyl ester carboxylesterase
MQSKPADDPLHPRNPPVGLKWILGALAGIILAAVLLLYGSLCLLFWQGEWQLIFHPSNTVSGTPASLGLAFDELRFGATETGQLPLDGWWVPSATAPPSPSLTVLYLHGPRGSLTDALPAIAALHGAGVNVFAFDPRGFGRSAWATPSERRWNQDADAAFRFLTETRHLAPQQIILCGTDLGASVAAELAVRQPSAAALVLDNPQPPTLSLLRADPRTRLLPVGLLARDRFDPEAALATSPLPKLFLALDGAGPSTVPFAPRAREPKQIALIPHAAPGASLLPTPEAQAALKSLLSRLPTGYPQPSH